jgi:hypothetical protein
VNNEIRIMSLFLKIHYVIGNLKMNFLGRGYTNIFLYVPTALTWIGFRNCHPDQQTIRDAKKSLDKHGGNSDKLVMLKHCKCV